MRDAAIQEFEMASPEFTALGSNLKTLEDFSSLLQKRGAEDTSSLAAALLAGALLLHASDVHCEPEEEQVVVRLRIDGILHEAASLPSSLYAPLLSRIKLKSGLKLNIEDRPQDGRFTFRGGEHEIEVRSSTLPSAYGESLVLRLLDPKALLDIQNLGLREDLLSFFLKELSRPNGMVIVTGPTGSGKTTTLYAFLREINKPEIKAVTIEDPIEYRLEGVSQTQVQPDKGYDFPSGLRAIVRQDPDVILVGEIRDSETAGIAIQAALTGHLVFSTLHTNDAAGTISRLESLGADPSNIGPALNLVVAQRLVRKACPECVTQEKASPQEEEKVAQALSSLPKEIVPTLSQPLLLPKVAGCALCNGTGYRGRVGIYEAIPIDSKAEKLILQSPSSSELREFAVSEGMVPMYQDGMLRVLAGITTIEEVERVSESFA